LPPATALTGATIVFDLDGTLVDTAPDLVGTLNQLLVEEQLPMLGLDEVRAMIGHGARALLGRGFTAAGVPLDDARMDRLFRRFIEVYLGRIARESRPFPGAGAALDALNAAGARLAVCTNKPTNLSVALLNALGLADCFDAIVGPDAAPAPKPDPAHLLAAIAQAGGRSDRALMVGDSATDATAARAAYVPLVLVTFGYTETPAAELSPDILIERFDDLPAACERLLASRLDGVRPRA
jgi:phosphoglycolate phosphatase